MNLFRRLRTRLEEAAAFAAWRLPHLFVTEANRTTYKADAAVSARVIRLHVNAIHEMLEPHVDGNAPAYEEMAEILGTCVANLAALKQKISV